MLIHILTILFAVPDPWHSQLLKFCIWFVQYIGNFVLAKAFDYSYQKHPIIHIKSIRLFILKASDHSYQKHPIIHIKSIRLFILKASDYLQYIKSIRLLLPKVGFVLFVFRPLDWVDRFRKVVRQYFANVGMSNTK